MAKKKETKSEAKIERVYNVPLRKEWLKAPMYKRAKKAGKALKEFLAHHMKVDIKNVKVGSFANHKIWERGIRFPPHHIKVNVVKDEKGIVTAELAGIPVKVEHKKETKKEEKKTEIEKKVEEKTAELQKEGKTEVKEKPKQKKEQPKPEEKKE
jgi:ribosomal protein L31E